MDFITMNPDSPVHIWNSREYLLESFWRKDLTKELTWLESAMKFWLLDNSFENFSSFSIINSGTEYEDKKFAKTKRNTQIKYKD